jgi:glycopeptide antibiotics resistance protein
LNPGLGFGSLNAYAWFIPGIAISALLATLAGGALGRSIRAHRIVASLLIFSVGTVLSATVTPSREALVGAPGVLSVCDFSRIGPAAWWAYAQIDDASLNVLLFVPLGVSIGLLPRSWVRAGLIVGAVLLPFGVETLQLIVTPLGRACQTADVSDNLMGLAIGLGLGFGAAWIGRRWAERRF